MEKQEIDFKIKYPLYWDGENEVSKLIEDLEAVQKLGATHIIIEHGVSYDCSYVDIDAIERRMETDQELQERLDEIVHRKEEEKRIDLRELERLKLKYGL